MSRKENLSKRGFVTMSDTTNPTWRYDERTETYVFGSENDGAGVLLDNDKWFSNVVHPLSMIIFNLGPFESQEIAQKAAIEEYERISRETQ